MTKLTQKFAQNESLNMFLFNKKTRNIIKYIWIVLTILIVLSMIIVYSGFSTLATTQPASQQPPVEVPPEVQAQLQAQKDGKPVDLDTSPEEQQVLKAIEEGRLNIDPNATGTQTQTPPADGTAPTTPTPTAPPLKLEI